MAFLHHTPKFLHQYFKNFLWNCPTTDKVIYLTFDDGPVPEVTPWVIGQLASLQAKATFFCVGDNVRKHPSQFQQIVMAGHQVGNHTFNHLNGWKTPTAHYLQNVLACQETLGSAASQLFRPPYGRITPEQTKLLKEQYKIVLWDVLSWDFERRFDAKISLKNTIKHTQTGSIVVFHDSVKSFKQLQYILPRYLEHFASQGFKFESL